MVALGLEGRAVGRGLRALPGLNVRMALSSCWNAKPRFAVVGDDSIYVGLESFVMLAGLRVSYRARPARVIRGSVFLRSGAIGSWRTEVHD